MFGRSFFPTRFGIPEAGGPAHHNHLDLEGAPSKLRLGGPLTSRNHQSVRAESSASRRVRRTGRRCRSSCPRGPNSGRKIFRH